jgi:hypothetical protein
MGAEEPGSRPSCSMAELPDGALGPGARPSRPGFGLALWLAVGLVAGFALGHVLWGGAVGLVLGILSALGRR